jgi:hypothetical protein
VFVGVALSGTWALSDASYTVRVRQIPIPQLNFTSEQNTNGFSNVAAGQLLNGQSVFYKVIVPTNVNVQMAERLSAMRDTILSRNALTNIDRKDPEDIEKHRKIERAND